MKPTESVWAVYDDGDGSISEVFHISGEDGARDYAAAVNDPKNGYRYVGKAAVVELVPADRVAKLEAAMLEPLLMVNQEHWSSADEALRECWRRHQTALSVDSVSVDDPRDTAHGGDSAQYGVTHRLDGTEDPSGTPKGPGSKERTRGPADRLRTSEPYLGPSGPPSIVDTLEQRTGHPEVCPECGGSFAGYGRDWCKTHALPPEQRTPEAQVTAEESKWPCFWCGSMQAHETGYPGGMSTVPACREHAAQYSREKAPQTKFTTVLGDGSIGDPQCPTQAVVDAAAAIMSRPRDPNRHHLWQEAPRGEGLQAARAADTRTTGETGNHAGGVGCEGRPDEGVGLQHRVGATTGDAAHGASAREGTALDAATGSGVVNPCPTKAVTKPDFSQTARSLLCAVAGGSWSECSVPAVAQFLSDAYHLGRDEGYPLPDGVDSQGYWTWQGERHPPPRLRASADVAVSDEPPAACVTANPLADRAPGESAPERVIKVARAMLAAHKTTGLLGGSAKWLDLEEALAACSDYPRSDGYTEGRREERAAICAWLRAPGADPSYGDLAAQIEHLDHLDHRTETASPQRMLLIADAIEAAKALPDECDACADKPGCPTLCGMCLAARRLRGKLAMLTGGKDR